MIEADFLFRFIQHGIVRTMGAQGDQTGLLKQRVHLLSSPAKIVEKFNTGITELRHLTDGSFEILLQFFSERIQLKADF
ncbi:hypothetical protein D3C73_1382570 [compost metagenome]